MRSVWTILLLLIYNCSIAQSVSIHFEKGSSVLSEKDKNKLNIFCSNSNRKSKVVFLTTPFNINDKSAVRLNEKRINEILKSLKELGTYKEQIIFQYGSDGPTNNYNLRLTTKSEFGSSKPPPPFGKATYNFDYEIYFENQNITITTLSLIKLDKIIELYQSDTSKKVYMQPFVCLSQPKNESDTVIHTRAWRRTKKTVKYLVERGVKRSKISFLTCGNCQFISIRIENLKTTKPPPFNAIFKPNKDTLFFEDEEYSFEFLNKEKLRPFIDYVKRHPNKYLIAYYSTNPACHNKKWMDAKWNRWETLKNHLLENGIKKEQFVIQLGKYNGKNYFALRIADKKLIVTEPTQPPFPILKPPNRDTIFFQVDELEANQSELDKLNIFIDYVKRLDEKLIVLSDPSGMHCLDSTGIKIRQWERKEYLVKYLMQKGIDINKIIFQAGNGLDSFKNARNAFIIEITKKEEDPINIPPPFPNLKRK